MNDQTTLSRAERQRIQLQAEIIEAAFLEFSERGYHQTAISDIAKRLGIGHGTFYRHFENKRDILDKVIVDTMFKITALLADENAPDAVSTLEAYRIQCERISSKFQEFAKDNPRAVRLILLEATSIDKEMTAQVHNLLHLGGLLTADYLKNGVKCGYLKADLDTEMTGHAIVGMIIAGAFKFLSAPEDPDLLKRYSDAAIQMMMAGIA
ncbi:TetR/AcrR family transcriptional regulator [Acinetobacter sp. C26M]|uniref:TetR/AcrR family transcriptional regulator n=1 Tax=unclassified Acinetobacter TaxID=196816 RepID=UPI001422DFA1|nr:MULTISPECIES: TetR/AcrR family transcriptional regulator [unclassified Acinetobacter]NIE95960.1 TetR/AcrR family transcriptional regulator [Acinetobacter sp. Tr-809]USA47486.1 TetR/AcrR family transcriptional regulator [Acinetobacter sp. C26M]USA50967.1 TetR/AcrR family transcriptional regulator [Acinetobacter sp. C26G]